MASPDRTKNGFTLIEVIIALGIAAGALILLLSANHESLRRSLRARHHSNVNIQAESKLAEILSGEELGSSGSIEGESGIHWRSSINPAEVDDIKGLEKVNLQIEDGNGSLKSISVLRYKPKANSR